MAEEVHAQSDTSAKPNEFRVKVYKLMGESEGNWHDQGTGFCVYNMVKL